MVAFPARAQEPDAGVPPPEPPPSPEPLEAESDEDEAEDEAEADADAEADAEPEEPDAEAEPEPEPDDTQLAPTSEPEPDPEPPPPADEPTGGSADPDASGSPTAVDPAPAPAPPTSADEGDPAPLDDRTATAPPPEVAGTSREAERQEEADAEQDDGRDHDVFWIEPNFGYSYVDLRMFRQENFLPSTVNTTAHGYTGGVALGFRISWLALGARGVAAKYPDFYIGSLMFDAALRIPIGVVEPYVRAGFGYAWVGNPNFDDLGSSEVDVFGFVAEAGAGLDIYLSKVVAIGVGADAAFLNLGRQDVRECGTDCNVGHVELDEDGDATGFQLRAQAHIGFHF